PAAPPFLGRGRLTLPTDDNLALDRSPGCDPLGVRNAVLAAVTAVRERRFPELDGVEIGGAGLVGVVLVAAAGLLGFHLSARLRVDGRLAERESLLCLHFGGADPLGP